MKDKIVMKVRPTGDRHSIRVRVDLRKVSTAGKQMLLNKFMDGIEISEEDALAVIAERVLKDEVQGEKDAADSPRPSGTPLINAGGESVEGAEASPAAEGGTLLRGEGVRTSDARPYGCGDHEGVSPYCEEVWG